jgi:GT2 family glycosyltransferase
MGKVLPAKLRLSHVQMAGTAVVAALLLWLAWAPNGGNTQQHGASVGTPAQPASVAIVVTVSGAPLYVAECLESLYKNTPEMTWVYVSDDSPTDSVADEIRAMAELLPRVTYLRVQARERPVGYTVTANVGLRAAYEAGHDVAIMVNSDTVLTQGWLPPLLRAIQGNPRIGMAGPLGNAASYQSVPLVKDPNGHGWAFNMPHPPGWTHDAFARLVRLTSSRGLARVPILNGFVFAIRREVVQAIGYFDEDKFPSGFGEENDFAFRVLGAGFEIVVCTDRCGAMARQHGAARLGPWAACANASSSKLTNQDTLLNLPSPSLRTRRSYVFHHKSKSYGHVVREKLSKQAAVVLKEMYKDELSAAVQILDSHPILADARRRVALHLKAGKAMLDAATAPVSVLFVLNAMPEKHFNMRGGWISVVQEALGLVANGAFVRIAVPAWQVPFFNTAFPDAEAHGMFLGYNNRGSDALAAIELVESGLVFDIGVATHYLTADVIRTFRRTYPSMIPAFYIQDGAYWILLQMPGGGAMCNATSVGPPQHAAACALHGFVKTCSNRSWPLPMPIAVESKFAGDSAAASIYKDMHDGFAFAKTQWLVNQMASNWGVHVHKIPPTVDITRFKPIDRSQNGKVHVSAMVRVETAHRNPIVTLQVLQALMDRFSNVTVSFFGSDPKALENMAAAGKLDGIKLDAMNNLGIAERDAVTAVMQQSDIFVDASTCVGAHALVHG